MNKEHYHICKRIIDKFHSRELMFLELQYIRKRLWHELPDTWIGAVRFCQCYVKRYEAHEVKRE